MKLNKTVGRVATTLVATAMLASLAAPAYAASAPTTSDEKVSFKSTLTLTDTDKFASVPSVGLTYTLSIPSDAEEGKVYQAATESTPEILAGVLPTTVSQTASFSNVDTWTGTGSDTVEKNVEFDFSDVVFPEPGIYRYVVTETDSTPNSDVTSDATDVRYLDLYVENGDGTGANAYDVYSYVLVKSSDLPTKGTTGNSVSYGNGEGSKNEGYAATYATNELDLSKTVVGELGNKNSGAFDFTVTVSGLTAGDTIGVKGISDDSYQEVSADTTSITLNNVKLGNTEHYYIVGLPTGADVSVTENLDDNEGYTTEYSVNAAEKEEAKTASVDIVKKTEANTIAFTNTKASVSPTGIVMDVAPYALLVVVAAAGCFVFMRKRRED